MSINNLSKAIPIRLTKNQVKALDKLKDIGFNKSKLIRIALDIYLFSNYKKLIEENKKIKYPF